jgi:hypothetical protein
MDLFMVNSGPADFFTPKTPLKNALYKNNRDGTFTDVTDAAGVAGNSFAMGVAVGDFDNDGYADLLVTSYGRPTLYKNNGNGTFTDITRSRARHRAQLDDECRLVRLRQRRQARSVSLQLRRVLAEEQHLLRRQQAREALLLHSARLQADAELRSITTTAMARSRLASTGTDIQRALGKALGVVATDINDDGLMDLFVANDTVQNFLFANRGKGNGRRSASRRKWLQCERHARARAWAWTRPTSTATATGSLRRQRRSGDVLAVQERRQRVLLGRRRRQRCRQATRLLSGWGLKFFDYDNDGNIDLFLANGHPDDMIGQYSQMVKYKEPLLLFHNNGTKLENVSAGVGPDFHRSFPARGLAVGDYNNDGRIDVFIGNNGEAPLLLKNNAGEGNHWLG